MRSGDVLEPIGDFFEVAVVVVVGMFRLRRRLGEADFEGAHVRELEIAVFATEEDRVGRELVTGRLQSTGTSLAESVYLRFCWGKVEVESEGGE